MEGKFGGNAVNGDVPDSIRFYETHSEMGGNSEGMRSMAVFRISLKNI
jgi:hypothetical protein